MDSAWPFLGTPRGRIFRSPTQVKPKKMSPSHPFRHIHLDFHTSSHIPNVGSNFDPDEFAETLQASKVDSVTLFAKCHHGHLYYQTQRPERHPHLEADLLRSQIAALKARGIRCPIYLSVQCDEFAANTHPDWIAVNPDGSLVGRKPFANDFYTWKILDMASPYADYLEEQILDVMDQFAPVDGIFLDMCWDQPSVSKWAIEKMQLWGLDPLDGQARSTYARRLSHEYMSRYTSVIESRQKNTPIWYNSRPLINLKEEIRFLKHIEIEALPTGLWGYSYFPTYIRLVKPMGLPLLGMTGRFHKSWADFGGLRTAPSLLYDCAQAIAHGAACSVGDQLHPSGRIDQEVYKVIGTVYDYVHRCEPWVRNSEAPKEIAVLYVDPSENPLATLVNEGVRRALSQLRYQFVYIAPDENWTDYPVVIVPETVIPDPTLVQRLELYVKDGGSILQEDLAGEASPYTSTYLRFSEGARGALPTIDHVFYEQGSRLLPREGDTVLARIVEPYFERAWDHFCSHAQTPPRLTTSPYAAGLVRGKHAQLALPVFRTYAKHANIPARQLIGAALAELLPKPILRVTGPSYVEAVVSDQGKRRIVHLLSFIPEKRGEGLEVVEESIPARDLVIDLEVREIVKAVTLQPQGKEVPFRQEEKRVTVALDWVEGHQMLVFDA